MKNDVIINKIETIRRCIKRVNDEYIGHEESIDSNYTKQDSIILNLERATQACIDVSTHIIRINNLGIPKTSRDVFTLLEENNILGKEISEEMKKMVSFRNIAVHDCQNISLDIVKSILTNNLVNFETFIGDILNA